MYIYIYNIILVEKSAGIVIVKWNYNYVRMLKKNDIKLEKSLVNIYIYIYHVRNTSASDVTEF